MIITSQAQANRRCERVGWRTVHHKADDMPTPEYIDDARRYKARHLAAVLHEFGTTADDVDHVGLGWDGFDSAAQIATGRILNEWSRNGGRGSKPDQIHPPGSDFTVSLVADELRRLEARR